MQMWEVLLLLENPPNESLCRKVSLPLYLNVAGQEDETTTFAVVHYFSFYPCNLRSNGIIRKIWHENSKIH